MTEYEINESTLALIAVEKNLTKVYEDNDNFIVYKSANKIMDESCSYFGSSLIGRQKGTSNLVGITHKAPIIVEESKEIIFFPTSSPRLETCSWISLNNFEKLSLNDKENMLIFKNKQGIIIDISKGIITNQILRATRLEYVLRNRKK